MVDERTIRKGISITWSVKGAKKSLDGLVVCAKGPRERGRGAWNKGGGSLKRFAGEKQSDKEKKARRNARQETARPLEALVSADRWEKGEQ